MHVLNVLWSLNLYREDELCSDFTHVNTFLGIHKPDGALIFPLG